MRDLDYLKLLSRSYPTKEAASTKIINLKSILALPKGTEYFFSDLHGESEAFLYMMKSSSGVVLYKINETFGDLLSPKEKADLANLIYYPRHGLSACHDDDYQGWQKTTINRLIAVCKVVSSKYTRTKVYRKIPSEYAYVINELLHIDESDPDKKLYHQEILNGIIETGLGEEMIVALSHLIQNLTIDAIHIIGDIFDRGPHADKIMKELIRFHDVDIEWGNHDAHWMGAAAGNPLCVASVLRIATNYNSFDVIEDGYGINLRPLSEFAGKVYGDDACDCFMPHLFDRNISDKVDIRLAAKMCKAITIIMLKLEGQMIGRHPEYHLDSRLLLNAIDYDKKTVTINGVTYPLKDGHFPTIDPAHPYALTEEESSLMDSLVYSFTHSDVLKKHIEFFFTNGSMYKVINGNLLFHGCIPMNEDGSFAVVETLEGAYSGKALMDYFERKARQAYFSQDVYATDIFYYLWCGPDSPLFGKDKMSTFEHCLIADAKTHVENYNAYYSLSKQEEYADMILKEFGIDPAIGHIVNGHVPVKVKKGEKPIRANGKVFVIDGGISKAYHSKTGIAGYTLIFNSHHLALAEHHDFIRGGDNTPSIEVVEYMRHRLRVAETDNGEALRAQIRDLLELVEAYKNGLIKEHQLETDLSYTTLP